MTIISCINKKCINNISYICNRPVVKIMGKFCSSYESLDENEMSEMDELNNRIYGTLDDSDYDTFLGDNIE